MTCVAQKRLCLRELPILVSAYATAAMLVDLTRTKVSFPPLRSEINSFSYTNCSQKVLLFGQPTRLPCYTVAKPRERLKSDVSRSIV